MIQIKYLYTLLLIYLFVNRMEVMVAKYPQNLKIDTSEITIFACGA